MTFFSRSAKTVLRAPAAETMSDLSHNMSTGERHKHAHVIEQLSKETNRSIREIEPLYIDILSQLRIHARIPDYLTILVSKRVKHILRH